MTVLQPIMFSDDKRRRVYFCLFIFIFQEERNRTQSLAFDQANNTCSGFISSLFHNIISRLV